VAPAPPAGSSWPPHLLTWWTAAWTSPLTAAWDEALDLLPVARLVEMYVRLDAEDAPNAALLAQVVKLETELGLTPAARKRQHVEARPVSTPRSTGRPSARDRLKVTAEDLLP
jgi:hypothetical protein